MPKKKRCKWCDQGIAVDKQGEHWVVKSIVPARITIVRCKLALPPKVEGAKPKNEAIVTK